MKERKDVYCRMVFHHRFPVLEEDCESTRGQHVFLISLNELRCFIRYCVFIRLYYKAAALGICPGVSLTHCLKGLHSYY